MKIVITGATGHYGKLAVKKILEKMAPENIGVSVRDPAKAQDLMALGVRVRHGNFDDPESLRHSFEGAQQILIVSSNASAYGGDPIAQHRTAIETARLVGAKRIVYTSQIAASSSSAFPPAKDHATTEDMLSKSGLAWTALRNGFYAESAIMMMGEGLKTGTFETTEDGKISWTAHADLAEAAAVILTSEGMFDGPTPPLTGSEALDFSDLAMIASEVFGKTIQRKILSDEDMRKKLLSFGAPEGRVALILGLYKAARHGEFNKVDLTLGRLLGREPLRMKNVFAEKISIKAD